MRHLLLAVTFALAAAARAADAPPAPRAVAPGTAAPDFTLTGDDGAKHSLSDAKGKYVVLEWFNPGCPFVKRHYGTKNMQSLQKTYTGKGVVWYSIASSAEGKQGRLTPAAAAKTRGKLGMSARILIDEKQDVARLYQARTTPHMFVIDPKGNVIYMGAIDDLPSTDWSDIKSAHNYVSAALDAALAGQPVAKTVSTPYGCSVKY